ncbi:uncharacterized protein LOC135388315 isoform X1 [Ornithodoros turicata]|uniref:uncharacterized protein LOC135388315 isoform X1 n=1 Tax=Ornithodoros turicata TaxID=34597 RepID=UPI003139D969
MLTKVLPLTFLLWGSQALAQRKKSCEAMPASNSVSFEKLSEAPWYESWTYPEGDGRCVIRSYDLKKQTMLRKEKHKIFGFTSKRETLPFIIQDNVQYLSRDGSMYQQVLATDNSTWAFIHVCWEGDGVRNLILLTRDRWSRIPPFVDQQILNVLQEAQMGPLVLSATRCA